MAFFSSYFIEILLVILSIILLVIFVYRVRKYRTGCFRLGFWGNLVGLLLCIVMLIFDMQLSNPAPVNRNSTAPSSKITTTSVTEKEANTAYVWVTATGSKYHGIPRCGNTKSSTEMTLEEAQDAGYEACSKCF